MIKKNGNKIEIQIPFNQYFINEVKKIGGKWNAEKGTWIVDEENVDLLNDILLNTVGCDINGVEDKVQVVYDGFDFFDGTSIIIGSLLIAKRRYRDVPVSISDGTIIINGDFPVRGGSAKYPSVDVKKNEVKLRSWIPRLVYDKLNDDEKLLLDIVNKKSNDQEMEVLEEKESDIKEMVKSIRNFTGLSRVDFSQVYGIPYRTLQDWELGKRKPPLYIIRLLNIAVYGLKNVGSNES